jgi:hypothetical protein
MCYSPEADLIAGLVVGAVGIDAIRHVDDRRDLALAAVPLVLATHQLVEAVAWWGLQGRVSDEIGGVAVGMYLVIALAIVPVLVPYAVWRAEPASGRRSAMFPFVVLGVCVAAVLLGSMASNSYEASIGGRFISYDVGAPEGGALAVLYGIAICTPLLMSSYRRIVVLGVLNVVAFTLLSWLLAAGFISLWCIWAAVSSVLIARHLREAAREHGSAVPRVRSPLSSTGGS